jgi:predicted Zn-dependent protease
MTGRRQLMLVPESQELSLGLQAYQDSLERQTTSSNRGLVEMVRRVGERISAVSQRSDFKWEFNLIADSQQNAFCLPGGKVAIYEGILPVCQDEAGLAVVMSHEIAHALARHGGERMSHNMAVDGAKVLIDKVAGKYVPAKKDLLMQAYGVGSKYAVLLRYNRRQESEADHIGLKLMAQAGYDPAAAPGFWTRFGEIKGSGQSAEFLSTHPSDQRRSADLQALMPEASAIYQSSTTKYGRGQRLTS